MTGTCRRRWRGCAVSWAAGTKPTRRFVRVLAAVLTDGLDAVEAAIREALDAGGASDDLKLNHPPLADCARYDTVRGLNAAA